MCPIAQSLWAPADTLSHYCSKPDRHGPAQNRDFLLCLGANEVIDYNQVRFEKVIHDVDVVLDTIGGETRERSWQVLNAGLNQVEITTIYRRCFEQRNRL